MKYTTLLLIAIALSSCESVSIVSNRDAEGKFINPSCPICGEQFVDSATIYRDTQDHYGVSYWASGSSAPAKLQKKLLK